MLTIFPRESWHVPRWTRSAFGLPRIFKQRWHPRTLNIFAHSSFGSGPAQYRKVMNPQRRATSCCFRGSAVFYLWDVPWETQKICSVSYKFHRWVRELSDTRSSCDQPGAPACWTVCSKLHTCSWHGRILIRESSLFISYSECNS